MSTLTLGAGARFEARVVALETQVHACMLHAVKVRVFQEDDPRLPADWLRDGLVATIRMQLGELRWSGIPASMRDEIIQAVNNDATSVKLLNLSPACLVAYVLGCCILPDNSRAPEPRLPEIVDYVLDILRDAHDEATCGTVEPTPGEWAILEHVDELWLRERTMKPALEA